MGSAGERQWLLRRLEVRLDGCWLAELVDVALEVAELEYAQQLAQLFADQPEPALPVQGGDVRRGLDHQLGLVLARREPRPVRKPQRLEQRARLAADVEVRADKRGLPAE